MATEFETPDYLQVKKALTDHLKGLSDFQDFNFDASGIQQILSLLGYNTAYNAFYLNMLAAEMFLDSAQLRSSVTSRAKAIGYVPTSLTAARAIIQLTVDTASGPLSTNPPFVRLNTSDQFLAYVNGKPYYFTPDRTYLIEPDANNVYTAPITLIEGSRLKMQYVVDTNAPAKQRFEIPNVNVDISTLTVKVQTSQASTSVQMYSKAGDVNLLDATSLVYFLQENEHGFYEVSFGENILGVQPQTGNVVILEYISANGAAANSIKVFSRVGKPTGYNVVTLSTLSAAQDGADPESIDSIKLLAPLLWEAQNRAVTTNDYEALIRKDNPNIEFVRVWGGEDSVPADPGKVYAAIKPTTGTRLSVDDKASITNRLTTDRNILAVEVRIVDPDYLYMTVQTKVNFRQKKTTLGPTDIKQEVFDQIVAYKNQVLNGFDADFTYSKLLATIDSVDQSIVGNITSINLKKRIFPAFNSPTRFQLNFYNAFSKGDSANNVSSISSTGYIYRGVTTYIGDDGQGALYLYRIVDNKKVIIQKGIGTVNYVSGVVVINSLDVQGIDNEDFIEIIAIPAEPDVVTPRESILLLDDADIAVFVDAIDVQGESI